MKEESICFGSSDTCIKENNCKFLVQIHTLETHHDDDHAHQMVKFNLLGTKRGYVALGISEATKMVHKSKFWRE